MANSLFNRTEATEFPGDFVAGAIRDAEPTAWHPNGFPLSEAARFSLIGVSSDGFGTGGGWDDEDDADGGGGIGDAPPCSSGKPHFEFATTLNRPT